MKMMSPNFSEGDEISKQFTGEGVDHSPALEWSDPPDGTKEFVLMCEDPDAPSRKPWVHWVVYHISASVRRIPENFQKLPSLDLPVRARQGKNSSGNIGYQGPMPPVGHGWHRYFFKLYALDRSVDLPAGATHEQVQREMRGHILGEAVLIGKYKRGIDRQRVA